MPGTILIVDDEVQLRKLLTRVISLEGFNVLEAGTINEALALLRKEDLDVVLCDVRLPDGNGVDFVSNVKRQFQAVEIILLTAYGNIGDGIQAIRNGAFDYIVKGDDNNRIIPLLYQAVEASSLRRKSAVKVNDAGKGDFGKIIGKSEPITTAVNFARKAAQTDATILLLGETGTGKEIFANAIHLASKRKQHPMLAVNCSAFNRELLESALFGHMTGAFTGASKEKKGLVAMAQQGTLFLDEIGELSIDLQAKLLRFLENGEYIKLGDEKVSKADVRIIAATNRDLRAEVERKEFREDLFYRLNIVSIELPPLRERREDIPLLIVHLLTQITAREKLPMVTVNEQAARLLENYTWKGNIRELKNILERAVVLGDGHEILPAHLPFEIQQHATEGSGLSLAEIEHQHIRKILAYTQGNKTKAAQLLEIGLATLYRKMQEYGISK